MQQHIFKPKYPIALFMGLIIMVSLEIFILWQILSTRDASPENIFSAVFFGLMITILPFAIVKRIVFNDHSFTIEKYFWPTKMIEYSEVVDIGQNAIRTKRGNLAFQSMSNAKELRRIMTGLIDQGKINRNQIENKLVTHEKLGQKALLPAGVISIVLWGVTVIFWPYKDSFFRDLSILAFFVPTYFVVFLFLKNRAESQ